MNTDILAKNILHTCRETASCTARAAAASTDTDDVGEFVVDDDAFVDEAAAAAAAVRGLSSGGEPRGCESELERA